MQEAQSRREADLPQASGVPAELIDGERVLVEVRTAPGSRAASALTELGGERRYRFSDRMFEAWVPIERLDDLAAQAGVVRVWPARLVQLQAGSVTTEGLAAGNAGPWHDAGLDGSGITIAIIDTFDDSSGEIADLQSSGDWPPDSQLTTVNVDTTGSGGSFGDGGNHGNAVLEIAYDIAPGADFIAYDTTFVSDWKEAIDQAVDDGADIISASLGAPLDSIGDGTAIDGSVIENVEAAADAGVIYINSAGNSREQHWGGLYDSGDAGSDPDLHSWDGSEQKVNFYGPGNGEVSCLADGAPLRGELFWGDWGFTNQDYDLVLFEHDGSAWVEIERSEFPQDGLPGHTPQEVIQISADSQQPDTCSGAGAGAYGWGVFRSDTTSAQNLQFFTRRFTLDQRIEARSLGFPADSPSAIAVAALNVTDSSHEFYSSEGPILDEGGGLPDGDEHSKPDTASFARVDTVTAGSFAGTSASAPHVAGMAALLKQRHPGMTRAELFDRLQQISVIGSNDLGIAGHDFQHGYGRLRFQLEDALVITAQPGDVAVGDPIAPVDLELRDDEGFVVLSGPTSEVDAAIGTDPSGGTATLSGTTTRAISDGLISFDDLSIDTAGDGYTLGMNSSGPGPIESDPFAVTAGAPAKLSFDVQPSDTDAGQAIAPSIVVQVLDSDGNLVAGDNSTEVVLSIATGPAGATLSGGGPVTVSSGEATFDSASIDLADTGYQLEAADTGGALTTDTSVSFDILPGDPASLTFDVQPSDADAGQAISPAIIVQVLDGQGNLVTDDNSTEVSLSIATGPSEATLSGGGPVTVSGGEATFDSASIDVADTGYTLEAADTGGALATETSASFDISPGSPAGLAFDVQPSETQVNETITPAVTVHVVDSEGNRVTDDNTTFVELAIASGPGGATLSGDGPVLVSNGEAVFPDASIDQVGTGYQLQASDTTASLNSDTSASFDVIAGDPAALAFMVQPSDVAVDALIEPAVVVEVLDADGNRVTWDDSSQVELQLSGGSGGNLSGGGPVTVTEGLAEFDALAVDAAGTDYQLEAVDGAGALTPANSEPFDVIVDEIFNDRFEDQSQ
ncbi:MAG: S8 family serine peptidase [Xanthomonadales bacterium]|nr:S8 family serine peptidase [Xanthomonadales bacterium]